MCTIIFAIIVQEIVVLIGQVPFIVHCHDPIRSIEDARRKTWYELNNPVPIRRKRPGESKQSRRARRRKDLEEIQNQAREKMRCDYLALSAKTALYFDSIRRGPSPKKGKEKKRILRRGHNYRRRWLISKQKERNSNKNKSSGMNFPRCWDHPRFQRIRFLSRCKTRNNVWRSGDVARAAARQELVRKRIFKHQSRVQNQPYSKFLACSIFMCNVNIVESNEDCN